MSNNGERNRSRSHMIRVRMSDEEYEDFQQKLTKSGQTMQSYVLNALQTGVIPNAELMKEVSDLSKLMGDQYKQLRGIAVNINQMAYNSNLEKLTGDGQAETRLQDMQTQVDSMRKECISIWRSLKRLMARNRLMER